MTAQLATATPSGFGHALRRRLSAPLEIVATASAAMACSREVERLMRLSDAELAAKGLRRDDIARHTYARYLTR